MTRQAQLDFLRGLAAVMVVANHTRGAFFMGGEKILAGHPAATDYLTVAALQITSFGTDAVVLFFVLSGFAMAHSVSKSSSVRRFYLKRAVRIWPPYIAACLMAALIGLWAGISSGPFVSKLFYVNAGDNALTPQFWSLPFEVVFYVLCPVILLTRERVQWLFGMSAVAFAASAVFGGLTINPWSTFPANFLGNELFLFACGAMAYHSRIPKVTGRTLALLASGGIAVAWISKRAIGEVNFLSMMVIAAVAVLAIQNTPAPKRLNAGFFSYSIYLFHYALIVAVAHLLLMVGISASQITNPVAWLPVAIAILLCCYVLYWFTERVSNLWVERLRRAT